MTLGDMFAQTADWAAIVCYAIAAIGCVYALVAAWSVHNFLRSAPTALAASGPAVTILKPLHGSEPDLYANLAGFCVQDYPGAVQIVFGLDSPDDPAIDVVHRLIADFPDRELTLTVNARRHGSNAKVSNLINMVEQARHDVLVLSDSDIAVDCDYLKRIVASLEQPGVGLVTSLYRGEAASEQSSRLWSRFAAAAIDYHFLPNVLVGLSFNMAAPCFGSTIALRRETLAAVGGFEAVANQLADDYALGALVRRAGLTVAMPALTVTHVCAERSAREFFAHELRWARTIRSIDPLGYAGLALTHALPLALLGILFGGITPLSIIAVAALACRFTLQVELDRAFRLRDDVFWLGPVRDILSFAVFVASFFGRGVEWRGRRYGVRADSTLAYYGEAKS
ncbi:MAG TPA: bacteriohopanetetrol glucosamine biosynthesis glycosyltransferase HpnI [Xanthobacteraceae bacterium]|jgi:ceramide glucosyltransferase|nr:bacteriohopanetetrol glucosamine biosynthesis glycosyltransferase HpnI [Xanthobacteraceae bacterium]